jgi:23S rRNA (pseudouridine1915-N3)-methyltransferase
MVLRARVLSVGKTKSRWVEEGVGVFTARLAPLAQVKYVTIKEQRGASTPAQAVARESERILQQASAGFWLLDERGSALRSVEFAERLQAAQQRAGRALDLVVGGAHGVSDEVKAAAGATVSLSAMTLTHDMAKLLLVEQVYRACTILKGGKYHHGD